MHGLETSPSHNEAQGYLASRIGVEGPHSDAIDALFGAMDRAGHAGANLAVVKDGNVIHRRGYGVATIEDDAPFTSATVLHLGSTSKHFCATAILMLEDRGRLALDDSIRDSVPELPVFCEAITLRHLLTMTSGLPDGLNFSFFAGLPEGAGLTRAAHLEMLARMTEPMFAPGAGMTYSNSNYLLLSLVVERLAGVSLAEFLRAEIFSPLGMNSTHLLSDMTAAIPNKATGYVPGNDGIARRASFPLEMCGDGGIQSTLDDMVKWFLHYRSGGSLVSRFRERLEAETILTDGSSIPYRLGMTVGDASGRMKIAHGGGMPGYLCDFAYFPDDDLGVTLLANWMDPAVFEATDAIANIVAPRKRVQMPEPDLPEGFFIDFAHGYAAELKREGARSWLHVMGEKLALRETGANSFEPVKASVFCPFRVVERPSLPGPWLEMRCGIVEPCLFEPVVQESVPLSDATQFIGHYRNDLLGETHAVYLEAGKVCVSLENALRKLLWKELRPRGRDVFSAMIPGEPSDTDMTVLFRRNEAGQVTHLEYNTSRTRNVAFERQT